MLWLTIGTVLGFGIGILVFRLAADPSEGFADLAACSLRFRWGLVRDSYVTAWGLAAYGLLVGAFVVWWLDGRRSGQRIAG